MKIILTQDVKKLGKKGGIIEVSDGYARNYILPQKLGVEANSKNLNDLKLQKSNEEKTMQRLLEEAQALAEKIGKQTVVVSMKAGEGGKVFGSVSSKEIAAAIKAKIKSSTASSTAHTPSPKNLANISCIEISPFVVLD